MAISGVKAASLIPGPAKKRENHVFGSGKNMRAGSRLTLGFAKRPISQAETGETKMPWAPPAATMEAKTAAGNGSPLASQIKAQVSRRTADGTAFIRAGDQNPP